jgi:hypothetical protein
MLEFLIEKKLCHKDQLWRVCAAVKQLGDDLYKFENIGQVQVENFSSDRNVYDVVLFLAEV